MSDERASATQAPGIGWVACPKRERTDVSGSIIGAASSTAADGRRRSGASGPIGSGPGDARPVLPVARSGRGPADGWAEMSCRDGSPGLTGAEVLGGTREVPVRCAFIRYNNWLARRGLAQP